MSEVRGQKLSHLSHTVDPQGFRKKPWFRRIVIMTNLVGDINSSVLMS